MCYHRASILFQVRCFLGETQRSAVRVWTVVLIGAGLFAAQFAWVVYNTYLPIFLQSGSAQFDALRGQVGAGGFGLNAVQTGLIMALDNLAAFLLQPLTGALSDRTRSRWGRRVPYLLVGMPAAALGMALIPLFSQTGAFAPFMACVLLMVTAMAGWRAPLFALMADWTPPAGRSQANGILNLMAGLGGILAFGVGSLLYGVSRPLPFWAAALILLLACGWIAGRLGRPQPGGAAAEFPPLGRWLWAWRAALPPERRRSLTRLTAAVFFYMLGFHPIEAFFSSYGVSHLGLSEANSGLVLSAAYITFILFAVPAGLLAGRLGRRRVALAGLVLFAGVLLAAFFTPWVWAMVVWMALGGLAWALIDINVFPMILDLAPHDDGQAAGTATGVYFVATTLAAVCGPVLNGWLIDLSGRNYGVIFLIGPLFFTLAFGCLWGVRSGHGEVVGNTD